jgi:hypothetical protein
MDQRYVALDFVLSPSQSGILLAQAPFNPALVPPGYYMLFLVNAAGAPSTARMIHLGAFPNEPECASVEAPRPELGAVAKNRFLSFAPPQSCQYAAVRLTFVDLPQPFNAWNGMKLYVGEPRRICENSGQTTPSEPDNPPDYGCGPAPGLDPPWLWAASLVCDPNQAHFDDWSAYGVVHVYHEGIVPSGVYNIQAIDDGCSLEEDANYSEPLTMTQTRWADVCGPGLRGACSEPPDGGVDVTNDVLGVLDKFANVNDLQKTRADLEPGDDATRGGNHNGPDLLVNVTNDVLFCLDAFTGAPYPFVPGDPCGPG